MKQFIAFKKQKFEREILPALLNPQDLSEVSRRTPLMEALSLGESPVISQESYQTFLQRASNLESGANKTDLRSSDSMINGEQLGDSQLRSLDSANSRLSTLLNSQMEKTINDAFINRVSTAVNDITTMFDGLKVKSGGWNKSEDLLHSMVTSLFEFFKSSLLFHVSIVDFDFMKVRCYESVY